MPRQISLQTALDRFEIRMRAQEGRSAHTVNGYRAEIDQVIEYLGKRLGREPTLADFHRPVLQEWLDGLPIKAATKQRKRAALSAFFRRLIQMEIYHRNPAAGLVTPPLSHRQPRFLPPHVVLAMMALPGLAATVWQLQEAAVKHLNYGAGLRPSELADLELEGILLLREPPAEGQAPPPRRMVVQVVGKRNKERTVPVPSQAAAVVEAFLARRHEIPGAQLTRTLFLSPRTLGIRDPAKNPRPFSRHAIHKLITREGRRLGVRAFPYQLRHSYATHIISKGGEFEALSKTMGHDQVDTTMRYAELSLDQLWERCTRFHPLHAEPASPAEALVRNLVPLVQAGWKLQLLAPTGEVVNCPPHGSPASL